MSDKEKTSDNKSSPASGRSTRDDRDPTNPTRATVRGTDGTLARGDGTVEKPLKPGNFDPDPIPATAPFVSNLIKSEGLETITVNAETQDKELEQLARDNETGRESEFPSGTTLRAGQVVNGRRIRRSDLPGKRQWYSDLPMNPNDLIRSNHGTSDVATD